MSIGMNHNRYDKMQSVITAARDVRNWLNGLRSVNQPPCVIDLQSAFVALDKLDGDEAGKQGRARLKPDQERLAKFIRRVIERTVRGVLADTGYKNSKGLFEAVKYWQAYRGDTWVTANFVSGQANDDMPSENVPGDWMREFVDNLTKAWAQAEDAKWMAMPYESDAPPLYGLWLDGWCATEHGKPLFYSNKDAAEQNRLIHWENTECEVREIPPAMRFWLARGVNVLG